MLIQIIVLVDFEQQAFDASPSLYLHLTSLATLYNSHQVILYIFPIECLSHCSQTFKGTIRCMVVNLRQSNIDARLNTTPCADHTYHFDVTVPISYLNIKLHF